METRLGALLGHLREAGRNRLAASELDQRHAFEVSERTTEPLTAGRAAPRVTASAETAGWRLAQRSILSATIRYRKHGGARRMPLATRRGTF
jgi:hypothetical protein